MKTSIFKSVSLLIMFTILSGCSSDSNSSLPNPTPCPQGYTGLNCATEITPTKITITKIRIKQFPNNGGGTDDLGTNPDLFISLDKSSSNVFVAGSYFNDANGNGTMNYDFPMLSGINSTSTSTIFKLDFWDYDNTSNNDLMNSIYFSPYSSTQGLGFPTSFNIQDSSGAYKAEVFVSYEW